MVRCCGRSGDVGSLGTPIHGSVGPPALSAAYAAAAPAYDRWIRPTFVPLGEQLAARTDPQPNELGLDLATGSGLAAESLITRQPTARLVGVDISAAMLGRRRAAIRPVLGDLLALPFADRTFDFVVCQFGLHHLADPVTGLTEAYRVTCPGGRLVVLGWQDTPDRPDPVEAIFRAALSAVSEEPRATASPVPGAVAPQSGATTPQPDAGLSGARPDADRHTSATTANPRPLAAGDVRAIPPARDASTVLRLARAAGWTATVEQFRYTFHFPDAQSFYRWRTAFPGEAVRLSRLDPVTRERLGNQAASIIAAATGGRALAIPHEVFFLQARRDRA